MTVDLTKITTPFGLLDPQTQEALHLSDFGVQQLSAAGYWITKHIDDPFMPGFTYRARPAPLVPDTIDWSHVAPEWKWMARDEDGACFMFKSEPQTDTTGIPNGGYWMPFGEKGSAWNFASYRRGTVAWQDSLVQRTEGV